MRGGGLGAGYSVGPEVLVKGMPYLVNDGSLGNCQAVAPGYALAPGAVTPAGLPGMKGGRRRKSSRKAASRRRAGKRTKRSAQRSARSKSSRKQAGGRYEVAPVPVGGMDTPNVAATNVRIACEAGQGSPLPSPTVPTEPAVATPPALPGPGAVESPGLLPGFNIANYMQGGALVPPYSGGTPLEETTAGYTHLRNAADYVANTQAGVPFMINVPSGGQLGVSNACTTIPGGTANANLGGTNMRGGRKLAKRSRKAQRKSAKRSRKASRKSAKRSRKGNRK